MTGRYHLDPALPVLLRPDDAVQIGWDPRRAVLVRPPAGMTATVLAQLLRALYDSAGIDDLAAQAARHGPVDPAALTALVQALVDAKVAAPVTAVRPPARRTPVIRVHGRGPLSDLLVSTLRCSGARISHSSHPHVAVRSGDTDLVVLSDTLVADPRLVRELQTRGVAHLPVRVRDGVGLVGPLVIPGLTSCLQCADLHRCDRDGAWPMLAAQLRDTVGAADRATILATAALAIGQVDSVITAITTQSGMRTPVTLSTTLEFDVRTGTVVTRRWPHHPLCGCRG